MNDSHDQKNPKTAQADRVPLKDKILYGSGGFAEMTFQWTLMAFALTIFNMELGYSPVLIAWVLALTRIWDAVTDPLMGSISDNARTRFGRRRPFIGAGAILSGFFFIAIWFIPPGLSDTAFFICFLVATLLFYTSFTMFSVPLLAMGYEMSPDIHERTKMMNVRIFANSTNGAFMFSWFILLIQSSFWSDPVEGIRMVGLGYGLVMIVLGLIPALTLKEKTKSYVEKQKPVPVLDSLKFTFSCKPFVFLVGAFFAALFAYNTVANLYAYPLRYFVCGGDNEEFGFWFSSIESSHHIATLLMLWPIAVISRRVGKRATCLFAPLFLVLGSIAYLFCFVPDMPWLVFIPRSLMSIGICGLFVLIPSMIADVVDYDELKTGTRREGMFGAIFFWAFKLALGIAVLISGYLLEMTGFQVELDVNQAEGTLDTMIYLLGTVPMIGAVVALYCIYKYRLTEKELYGMRAELENRRGVS